MKSPLLTLAFSLLTTAAAASAQEPMAAARELYAAAAYEDALDVLGRMRESGPAIASTDVELLRAFCLLALRREDDAKAAIEDVVIERPMYMPGEDEASPRIRSAFQEVRRRLLPAVVRQLYQSARDDYEKKELVGAAAKFGDLVRVLGDPDVANNETLADLRMLADGFRALSAAAAHVATASGPSAAAPADPAGGPPAGVGPPAANAADAGTITRSALDEATLPVTPPVAINQRLPSWRGDAFSRVYSYSGAVDLVIDENGRVESVSLRKSVNPLYDAELLRAAKTWTYRPAVRGGKPVKFQKTLIVKVSSGR